MKAAIVILIILCREDHFAHFYNIALRNRVYPNCGGKVIRNSSLTDGILDPSKYLLIDINCDVPRKVEIEVSIKNVSLVGHVIVYSGACGDCDSLLDFFMVKLLSTGEDTYKLCGQYSGRYLEPGHPMRVNCNLKIQTRNTVEKVAIYPNSHARSNFRRSAVSEIEVYYFDSTASYYGCYKTFAGKRITSNKERTCKRICSSRDYRFMRKIDTCECGNDRPSDMIEDNNCSIKCKHDSNISCSDEIAQPIYLVNLPHIYISGCFRSNVSSDAINVENMTASMCIRYCTEKNVLHAYLQNANYCYCKDKINEVAVEGRNCNILCGGGNMTCGGKDDALVYSGCTTKKHQSQCWKVLQCEDEAFDEFGTCPYGCKDGFLGESCTNRELPPQLTTWTKQSIPPNDSNAKTKSYAKTNTTKVRKFSSPKIPVLDKRCLEAYQLTRSSARSIWEN